MFSATSYAAREGNLPAEPNNSRNTVHVPPTATVLVGPNVTGVSGRLEQRTDVSLYVDATRGLNFDVPNLTFSKPTGTTDTNRTGSCQFFVYNVPPFHPFFDLELSVLRGAGVEQTVSVKLEVMQLNTDGVGALKVFNGILTVPSKSPMVVSRRIVWLDGEPVTAFDGEERRMPSFFHTPLGQYTISHTDGTLPASRWRTCNWSISPCRHPMRSMKSLMWCPCGLHSTIRISRSMAIVHHHLVAVGFRGKCFLFLPSVRFFPAGALSMMSHSLFACFSSFAFIE